MTFAPNFWTSLNGSMPHTDAANVCQQIASSLDVPVWSQLSRLNFRENMYTQFSAVLPALVLDEKNQKIIFDTSQDITPTLEIFYTPYLEEDLDFFGLRRDYAAGFYAMLEQLKETPEISVGWVKGQVTGPISTGLTVTDQDLRAALYDEIFEAIHSKGGLAGVHCCANTDWSVLLKTQVDILNLDAYGYIENLALYPEELHEFLDRSGVIAWGIIPNTEVIDSVTPQGLADQLRAGIKLICDKAGARGVSIQPEEFNTRSLITPACGLGPTTVAVADKVLPVLVETGQILRNASNV